MAETTKIEWCDATFIAVNPWWGCERVSPACAHCYADTFARRLGMSTLWDRGSRRQNNAIHGFRFFGDGHWAEPLRWARTLPAKLGRRPRVFCASMADVFEEREELQEHRLRLFDLIVATPELDWLILTKRPEFARDWLAHIYDLDALIAEHLPGAHSIRDYPIRNVWVGVSIENARYTWRADVLRQIPAAVRFISAEPLLGSLFVDATPAKRRAEREASAEVMRIFTHRGETPDDASSLVHRVEASGPNRTARPLDLTGIDWVIIGGESGPGARPFHLEHARELLRVARLAPDPPAVFVKQLGARPHQDVPSFDGSGRRSLAIHLRDAKGGDGGEWPVDLRIREFPISRRGAAAVSA